MSKKRIGSLLTTGLFLAVTIAAAMNIQRIQDTILFYQYEPQAAVASLVGESGMSERGKFLFYASQPALQQKSEFNQHCEKQETTTAILGCYDGLRIYIYDIPEPRLAGIRPTTAAHEMLHAAYRRLSTTEKQEVDALLVAEYNKLKDNAELASRMAFYARTQPGERENELHSIIGTEVGPISSELEAYYSRYFEDRSKVLAQYEQYHSLFQDLVTEAETMKRRIDEMRNNIDALEANYEAESRAVDQDILRFNARTDAGDFQSQSQFARERQILVTRLSTLEAKRSQLLSLIEEHNALVLELEKNATELDALNRSLDSQLAPAPIL